MIILIDAKDLDEARKQGEHDLGAGLGEVLRDPVAVVPELLDGRDQRERLPRIGEQIESDNAGPAVRHGGQHMLGSV